MITLPRVLYEAFEMKGGWDQITPTLSLPPGVVKDCKNYECAPSGGYARVGGYERFDGRTKPSAASYVVVQVASFTNTPALELVVTQAVSGASGTIVALGADYMVVTLVTGSFDATNTLSVPGPIAVGTATTTTVTISAVLNAQYLNVAADVYRALIAAPTGSGAIRGVVAMTFADVDYVYAFRDNAGATACNMWKATTSGWSQITFKNEISFTAGGTATPADGATLTQGANTAIVRRVMTQSGAWTGTAAGRFIVDTPAPGDFAAGAATLTGGAAVTLSGAQTAITLLAGGKFEFAEGNFSGQLATLRLYGCDGVNRMFEYDGTTFAPIATGLTTDTPKHLAVHKNYLFCSSLSSIFYPGVGTPYKWLAVDGGGEIATGDTVTGLLTQPGEQTTGALAVYGRSRTSMLYGVSPGTWNFTTFNTSSGAFSYTTKNLAQSYALDDVGVMSLATSLNFGNFEQATLTNGIKTFINETRARAACSLIHRGKSQYRIYFSTGDALYLTIVNGKMLGVMRQFFPTAANCAWTSLTSTGVENSYFGGADGQVYQLDIGSSFDGADVDAFVTLNWNGIRSPRIRKRFRHASLEMQGNQYAAIQFGYALGYGAATITQPTAVAYSSSFSGAPAWDAFTWDSFTWDGQTISPTEVDVTGTAENIQITISSTTDYIMPYTLNSLTLHYTPRRGLR